MKEDRLFEIYKLHAELAERVASSRLNLNKIYAALVTSIVAVHILLSRLNLEELYIYSTDNNWPAKIALPVVGLLVSISWLMSIWNITGHLRAKNETLRELEADLPFRFLETELSKFQEKWRPKNSTSSMIMPSVFLVVCIVWIAVIIFS